MEKLTNNHDLLKQTIAEQEADQNCHPLIGKINAWEQESIEKIHQAAINARKDLLNVLCKHRTVVINGLQYLTQELNNARGENDYVEPDLKEWKEKLQKLKTDLIADQTIDFGHDKNNNVLISKISINDILTDIFCQPVNDMQILENGNVVVHGQKQQYGLVRGRNEYSSGQHQLCFQIEHHGNQGNLFCGVLTKNIPTQTIQNILYELDADGQINNSSLGSYPRSTHSTLLERINCLNQYGYTSNYRNQVFNGNSYDPICGMYQFNTLNKNQIIELLIDCDQQTISLINERTRQTQNLNVDLAICPFPWQFCLIFACANGRIRLCEEKQLPKKSNIFPIKKEDLME
ncbi:hypothetical protein I4U23_001394 [Adineta vaga]|nr:hypothetical protein I4U23_001394 [Adineta vaga]